MKNRPFHNTAETFPQNVKQTSGAGGFFVAALQKKG